jgi:hypothetical protein
VKNDDEWTPREKFYFKAGVFGLAIWIDILCGMVIVDAVKRLLA